MSTRALTTLERQALVLLLNCPEAVEDARQGAPRGNSIAGGALCLNLGTPRWAAEQAVVVALGELPAEAA